ncbi:hypothetical protein PsYK624_160850 [Phanerochaete sordida]|uniref:Uncharacterized protein n=1 Tax=Phanerochaete sordida TaxID=48140 RepID=A0A9P3GQ54_9APHY|nr:hypothetical protein PsYK624_160850 [Phanerochaete sordida]
MNPPTRLLRDGRISSHERATPTARAARDESATSGEVCAEAGARAAAPDARHDQDSGAEDSPATSTARRPSKMPETRRGCSPERQRDGDEKRPTTYRLGCLSSNKPRTPSTGISIALAATPAAQQALPPPRWPPAAGGRRIRPRKSAKRPR